jgi:hypothetical protein
VAQVGEEEEEEEEPEILADEVPDDLEGVTVERLNLAEEILDWLFDDGTELPPLPARCKARRYCDSDGDVRIVESDTSQEEKDD